MNNEKKIPTGAEVMELYMNRLNPEIETIIINVPFEIGTMSYRDVTNLHEETRGLYKWLVFDRMDTDSGKPTQIWTQGVVIHSEQRIKSDRPIKMPNMTVSQMMELYAEDEKKKQRPEYACIIFYVPDAGSFCYYNPQNLRFETEGNIKWLVFDIREMGTENIKTVKTAGTIIHSERFI